MAMEKTILKKILMPGLVTILLLFFVGPFSFASELDDVKAAIEGKGAKWIAGETSLSKLPSHLRKLRVGLIEPEVTGAEKFVSVGAPILGLPAGLDWRYNPITPTSSTSCVTPVRDQGNCGSCWAFATTGALESYTLIKSNCPGSDLNLAEQILLSCSSAGNCGGGYIDRASNFIRDTGLPQESCYPYTATNGNCSSACTNWQSDTDRIDSWSYVATTSPTVDTIKNALNTHGPLVTTMRVYTDFFYYGGGVYSYASGKYEGGHAILIVGYNDSGQYFIVKNSWGTSWGESGFFNIAYSQINNPVQFGYYTIAYEEGVCTYSISPTSKSFDSNGGTGSVTVTAPSGCSWTATSNVNWITITSGSSGNGNGTVGYSLVANMGTTSRSGTMTIAGQTFTVTQAGASCTYSISPTSNSFPATDGSGTISVTAGTNCSWTAKSNSSWITITSGASGTGNGSVGYKVSRNTTKKTRTGTITVAGKQFTVTQNPR
jgi:hypothetical protein